MACGNDGCSAGDAVPLGAGKQIRLWTVPGEAAHPVLEMRRGDQVVGWMPMVRGQSSGATLSCDARGDVPNCVVISAVGVHSALAEMILIRPGRMIDTGAFVTAATPTVVASDLDGDTYLDVSARDSDYTPNFAQGHEFDRTYRYDAPTARFVATGCSPRVADPVHDPTPTHLQTGACPPT